MNLSLLLWTLLSLSPALHAATGKPEVSDHAADPSGHVGRFLSRALARVDRCSPSAHIERARPRRVDGPRLTAEQSARRFTTQLIRTKGLESRCPEIAHGAFGMAIDELLLVYGLHFSDRDERQLLEDTGLLMAFTSENIDRFWQTVGVMMRGNRSASDPKVWLGRIVAAAGGPNLTSVCELRLDPEGNR